MRTKHFLTALCLPLAFAACTNDDFVSEAPSTLGTRGEINVTLTAAKPAIGVDTKLGINTENMSFLWEKGTDVIGAALTDGAAAGTVGNDVYVNYPFVADADGNTSTFSGMSSVTAGMYFFYFGYQDVLDRAGLPLGMPEQVYDATSSKSALEQAASYMKMISPIIDLEDGIKFADTQNYNLNLRFANLYTVVQVNINSANIPTGVSPKVTKIKLDGKDGSGNSLFPKDAEADLVAIAGTSNANVVTLDDDGQVDADEQTSALEAIEELIAAHSIYTTSDVTSGAYELKIEGDVVLSTAAATPLYILVPKGEYATLDLTVETSEGSYTREVSLTSGNITLANQIQPIKAELNFATDGTGNVLLPGEFTVSSADEWAEAVEFMTSHAVGYINKQIEVNLTKSIAIDALPIFNLEITGVADKDGNYPTLTLNKDYTINSDNDRQFTVTNVTLGVAAGATLSVSSSNFAFTGVANDGTLNLSAANFSKEITNFGTLNVNSDVELSGGLTNGRAENKNVNPVVTQINGTVAVAANKTLTITTKPLESEAGTITINSGAKIANNVAGGKNAAASTINNKGTLDGTAALENKGTIDNYGKLAVEVTNTDGKVIVEDGSTSDNAVTVTGGTVEVKNITTYSALQVSQDRENQHYVYGTNTTVTTLINNTAEFIAANKAENKINDITLNGGEWTLAVNAPTTSTTTKVIGVIDGSIDGITLNGATLKLGTDLSKNLAVAGTSSVTTTVNGGATVTGDLTVEKNGSLTVGNGVTFNEATAASLGSKAANLNGNLTVSAGAAMYFNTAEVGQGATLSVKGSTNTLGAAVFGVNSTFTNKGTVISEASTATENAKKAVGKVSQPNNGASGTFKGNATNNSEIFS